VKKYKSNIENLTRDCKSNLEKFEKQIEIVSSCEECIKTAETKIRDVSIDMIADIRNRLVGQSKRCDYSCGSVFDQTVHLMNKNRISITMLAAPFI